MAVQERCFSWVVLYSKAQSSLRPPSLCNVTNFEVMIPQLHQLDFRANDRRELRLVQLGLQRQCQSLRK